MPIPELMRDVAPATADALGRAARERRYGAGAELSRQGDLPAEVLIPREGRCRVWRVAENGVSFVLGFAGPGEVIGLHTALNGGPAWTNITVVIPVKATALPMPLLGDLARGDARFAFNIARFLADRVDRSMIRMEEIAASTVPRRIARVLVRLLREYGSGEGARDVALPVSHGDLAELAGTTLPTVSRVLGRWRAGGLLGGGRGEILVRDPAAFARIGWDGHPG